LAQAIKNYAKRDHTLSAETLSGPYKALRQRVHQEHLPLWTGTSSKRYLLDFKQMVALVQHLLAKEPGRKDLGVNVAERLAWLHADARVPRSKWDISEDAYPKDPKE
jgi:hypothetical protein